MKNPVGSGKAEMARELRLAGVRGCFPKTRHFAYVSRDTEGRVEKEANAGRCWCISIILLWTICERLTETCPEQCTKTLEIRHQTRMYTAVPLLREP